MWPIFFVAEKCRHKTLCSPYDYYDCSSSFWYQAHFIFIMTTFVYLTDITPDESSLKALFLLLGDGMSHDTMSENSHRFVGQNFSPLALQGGAKSCRVIQCFYRWHWKRLIDRTGLKSLKLLVSGSFLAMFTRNRQGEQKWWQKLAMNQQLVGSPESPKSPCSSEFEWHEHAWTAS